MSNSPSRHNSRRVALARLFAKKFQGEPFQNDAEMLSEAYGVTDYDLEHTEAILKGVEEHQAEIDELVTRFAPEWAIDQIDLVDLSCLRIAFYELLFQTQEVPMKVVIDEAIELAKEFGGENSGGFVNGVLGSYVREKEEVPK